MEWLNQYWWVEALIIIFGGMLIAYMVCWLFDICEYKDKN